MDYKLIAVDLDDSLLDKDLKISETNKRALFAARNKGVQITIATGRMLDSAMPYIRELNIDIPVITYQGAFIKDTLSGNTLIKKSVSIENARKVIDICSRENLHIQVYTEDSYFFEEDNCFSRLYRRMSGIQGEAVGDLKRFLNEEPIKLLIIDEPDNIARYRIYFQRLLSDVLQVYISRPNYLEFTNIEATKGNALAQLGRMLGVSRKEMIAIGDSYNDISMLEYAGLGVAMGNAPDNVKSHAGFITGSNDEDGVAEAVEKFVLMEE
ncbi:MAG: Cof-type HAD-IIB family hydrolase [Caldicoprobacterales bacterium]|nr:HAD family phosphatase [Clostridiales bacterium]